MEPKATTALDVAFGNAEQLPKWDTLPEEFRKWHTNKWCRLASHWFYKGLDIELMPKPGIDANAALAAVAACLGSWQPKHEHKIGGCAYMLSQWFEEPSTWPE